MKFAVRDFPTERIFGNPEPIPTNEDRSALVVTMRWSAFLKEALGIARWIRVY
jgi:hypothetical protein